MAKLFSEKNAVVKKAVSFRMKVSTADQLIALRQSVKAAGSDVKFHLDAVVDEQLVKCARESDKFIGHI